MSRIEKLEDRVRYLERNVGAAMGTLGLNIISTREASDNYRDGRNNPSSLDNSKMINPAVAEPKFVCAVGKRVAFRYYGKPIYYPAEHAVFDLHIPAGKHYVWHGIIYISTGVVRSVNENDIRDILIEDHSDFNNTDLIQDMEHPHDLYVVDRMAF